MDDLSSFFSNDVSSTVTEAHLSKINNKLLPQSKKNKSLLNPRVRVFDQFGVLRNASDPNLSNHDTFGLEPLAVRQSSSFPCSKNLPYSLPPEIEEGNIEYKLKLIDPSQNRLEHLITQMKWRLKEGAGQAIYRLGVDDKGVVTGLTAAELTSSMETVYRMARLANADVAFLRECTVKEKPASSELTPIELDSSNNICLQRKAVEVLVKQHLSKNLGLPDICIAMLGSVDVGKSTLLGILYDGDLDNGRGRARLNLFHHLHEVQTGRTSSLSSEIIGFDAAGNLINRKRSKGRLNRRTIEEVVRDSTRLITLLDLAGHPKYQRTTMCGLVSNQLTFCILVVSATGGLIPNGLKHARTAVALGLPIISVISKLDLLKHNDDNSQCNDQQFDAENKVPIEVDSVTKCCLDVQEKLKAIECFYYKQNGELDSIKCFNVDLPIFPLSNVSGDGLDDLLTFLARVSTADISTQNYQNLLVTPKGLYFPASPLTKSLDTCTVKFWITKVFLQVPGVKNAVLGGVLKSGKIYKNQKLWLGPDENGLFRPMRVIELRRNWQPHEVLHAGQIGSLTLDLLVGNDNNQAVSESETTEQLLTCETKSVNSPQLSLSSIRRGMVLLNYPLFPPNNCTHVDKPPPEAVCWSFSVHNLVCIPPINFAKKNPSLCCFPSLNSTFTVYCGNISQHAKLTSSSVNQDQWRGLTNASLFNPSALFRLDGQQIVCKFLRRPEYLDTGQQLIMSFTSGLQIIGQIKILFKIVCRTSPSPDYSTTPLDNASLQNGALLPCETNQTLVPLTLEEMNNRIGITTNGYFTSDVIPSELLVLGDVTNLSSVSTNRRIKQRHSKRKRKSKKNLAKANEAIRQSENIAALQLTDAIKVEEHEPSLLMDQQALRIDCDNFSTHVDCTPSDCVTEDTASTTPKEIPEPISANVNPTACCKKRKRHRKRRSNKNNLQT